MDDDEEKWAVIPQFPRYEVSTKGGLRQTSTKMRLKPNACTGYFNYNFTVETGKKRTTRGIHRVMWEAHIGPIPEGLQINHMSGIKTDNRLENFELVTIGDNIRHAHAMGLCPHWKITQPERIRKGEPINFVRRPWTRPRGERHGLAKVTADIVRDMRRRHANGETAASLGREYGISKVQVCNIVKRKVWKEVA